MPIKITAPFVGAVLLPNLGGWVGGFITRKNINPWYQSLKKPTWTPPNWAFAPIWTGIYCSMGAASYLVWRDGGGFEGATIPLSIFGANVLLNWTWTPLFFGAHKIKLALYENLGLWCTTVGVGVSFYSINPISGYLIIPYFAWNSLAVALNYAIYRDNCTLALSEADKEEKKE